MENTNWSPYATNPLDFVTGHSRSEAVLISRDGEPMTIAQSGTDFVVIIGDRREITGSNINTCYYLNINEVKVKHG